MKRVFLLPLLFLFNLNLSAQLQVDAKLNLGSLLTGGVNVAGDVMIDPNFSASLGLAYATTNFNISDGAFRYRAARFIPEGRYYVSPEYGADRFFVGAYGKAVSVRATEKATDQIAKGTRLVLGPLAGYKWILPSGILIELNAGVGASLFLSDGELASRAFGLINLMDIRLGIIGGYRF
ncbi:DUF3575 domain-containing protein [Lewinella sp. 4G2]|uniref:DUF3575 domain-containing protein n=1 Tax=Lewinella sp. 4G2 TaxID=1803372 RepID=UPI0007B4E90E|nr:DUF3575 domain-containing protein [Lewinella sp. 4G2]OAV42723.1 hypothetical protein A3850_015905 [Lewinella sp. 4G2]